MSGWSSELFVHCMDTYLCAICREVCKDAVSINCGHTFCNTCIMKTSFTYVAKCPVCRTIVTQSVPDFSKRLAISGSHTYCEHREHGCPEVDALCRMIEHTKHCNYKLETCPDCSKEYIMLEKEKHEHHECENRLVPCTQCHTLVPYHSLDTHTHTTCPMIDASCDHCEWTGLLRGKAFHSSVCAKTPRPCFYKSYGCEDTITLETRVSHESDTDHLSIVCKEMDKRTDAMYQYINSVRADGPFYVQQHPHPVMLSSCISGKHECSVCHHSIVTSSPPSLSYECKDMTCPYTVCLTCFPSQRLYKSKQMIGFSFLNSID